MSGGQSEQRSGYIPAIDGLRAIAVASVVLYHLWPAALPGGFTGVDIFFVISGFVVTGSMTGRSFASLKELLAFFYARRLVRIMPALIAMLLVAILATQLFVPDAWLSRSVAQTGVSAFAGLSNIALALDSDTYFGPQASFNPFTHTWSLGVEEQFYLLFPFLIWGHLQGKRDAFRLVAWLSIASLILCAVLSHIQPRLAFYLMPTRFWELGLGMLLCLSLPRWQPWVAARGWIALPALAAIAAGFAIPYTKTFPFPVALLPVLGTAALIALVCAQPGSVTARLFETRPMVAAGKLSYSLYLWHWPVFVLFRWTSGLDTLPLQLATLALSIALSIASYLLVEQPLRTSQRLLALPRPRVVKRMLGATLIAMLAGTAMFVLHDRITLSVTANRADWYAESGRPVPAGKCRVREEVAGFHGGKVTSWIPEGCTTTPAGFTLFAIGDSHNLAYAPNYARLAAEQGITVRAWFKSGCPFLRLNDAIPTSGTCSDYEAALLTEIGGKARKGDVVFLPGLRIMRLINQFDGSDTYHQFPASVSPETMAQARRTLAALAASKVTAIFEAPKPVLPSPPFRCSDWFNRNSPICRGGLTMSRAELEARRAPILRAMGELGTRVWDPFPLLCPGATCEAVSGGRPLFFDGDHLSGHGNDLLYPAMRDAILAAHRQ
ncbi:acyltransferase family protein [Sphingomonas sp. AOB5]|uniref:acyltransferase family protein n=1 Tax=Sphingomonas sp. AOB5 TaxID=3034017 RepID=UPI0023F6F75B|nr:acyltransferase family protein [Sphingomonas sp. AOB5]MDF7776919.1 acyltransferase family protein [Sphingomonas sp. AOB5]